MAGINISNIGGNVSLDAGADIVGGDKTTTTTTTTTQYGFSQPEDKQQFIAHVDELRSLMKEMNSRIDDMEGLDDDQKEELEDELSNQIKNIRQLKKDADQLEPNAEPDSAVVDNITKHINSVSGIIEKIESFQEKSTNFASTVGDILVKSAPLLLSARHLFGMI